MTRRALKADSSAHWGVFGITEIPDHEDSTRVYLKRWRLIETPYLGVKVHHIRMADNPVTRGLHDHPWSFVSIRLRGNYDELRPGPSFEHTAPVGWDAENGVAVGVYVVKRRRFWSFTRSTDLHAVIPDNPDRGVWTLVFNGPRVREWGFRFSGQPWMPWHQLHGAHARNVRGRAGSTKEPTA